MSENAVQFEGGSKFTNVNVDRKYCDIVSHGVDGHGAEDHPQH